MKQCPICQTVHNFDTVNQCQTCSWDLSDYALVFQGIPQEYEQKLELHLTWARQTWEYYQQQLLQTQELSLVKQENLQLLQSLEHLKQEFTKTKADDQRECAQLQSQLERTSQERSDLSRAIQETESQKNKLEEFSSQLQAQLTKTQSELTTERSEFQKQLNTATQTHQTQQQKLEEDLQVRQRELQELAQERSQLSASLESCQQKNIELNTTLKSFQQANLELSKKLEQAESQINNLQSQVRESKVANDPFEPW